MTEPTDLTIHVLREIRDEMRLTREELRGEMRGMRDELGETNARVDRLAQATLRGFTELAGHIGATNERLDRTNERLDCTNERLDRIDEHFTHFRGFVGEHWRDHEQRIRALEAQVGPPARP